MSDKPLMIGKADIRRARTPAHLCARPRTGPLIKRQKFERIGFSFLFVLWKDGQDSPYKKDDQERGCSHAEPSCGLLLHCFRPIISSICLLLLFCSTLARDAQPLPQA